MFTVFFRKNASFLYLKSGSKRSIAHRKAHLMFPKKAINRFFLGCALLVMVGEIHRCVSAEPKLAASATGQNIPHKILTDKSELVFPVPGKSREDLIGFFGDPRAGGGRKHQGIDIAAKRGAPVVAIADGTVTKVKEGGNGGKQVWMVAADEEYTFFYAHLQTQSVEPGQFVRKGTELGTVGSTGNAPASAPHLHFEILTKGRAAVDPLKLLP